MSRAVIDQPGLRITVIGLALAVFMGLALRSQISDARVQGYLNQAVERLQKDVSVDYQNARVNLSKWGLPFPVLEILQVRLSAKNGNCRNSQIAVDEIEVPISISTILGLTTKVPKIRLRQVEVRLSDLDRCFVSAAPATNPVVPANKSAMAVSRSNEASVTSDAVKEDDAAKMFNTTTGAELSEIYIEKLKIIHSQMPDQPVLFKQIGITLQYDKRGLSEVEILSKVNAFRDSKSDIYYLNANMNLMVKRPQDSTRVDVSLGIDGKLLDGDVQFFTHFKQNDPQINYELLVNKVSAKAFLPFIQGETRKKISFLEKVPASIGFKNTGQIETGNVTKVESKIKKIEIIIENAQLKSGELNLVYDGHKLEVKPFELLIDSLPLSRLKQVDSLKSRFDSFESLGVLSGKLKYVNENQIQFDGLLRQLEVVFSNRGRRDLQRIEEMNFHLKKKEKKLYLVADSMVVDHEKIDGEILVNYDTELYTLQAELELSGVLLNRRVWDQFTYVEQAPRIDIKWNYHKSLHDEYTLKLTANKIELPGVVMSNIKMDVQQIIDGDNGHVALSIRPSGLATNERLYENEYVNQILNQSFGYTDETFTGEKISITMKGQDWHNLAFSAEAHLIAQGDRKAATQLDWKGKAGTSTGFQSQLGLSQKDQKSEFDIDLIDQQLNLRKTE